MRRSLITLTICCLALLSLPVGSTAATAPATSDLVVGHPGTYQFSVIAAGTCTASTTCSSGTTISCDGTTPCSNDDGVSVTCNGSSGSCTVLCSDVDAAAACKDDCDAEYQSCLAACNGSRTCAAPCIDARFSCYHSCPHASTSCSA